MNRPKNEATTMLWGAGARTPDQGSLPHAEYPCSQIQLCRAALQLQKTVASGNKKVQESTICGEEVKYGHSALASQILLFQATATTQMVLHFTLSRPFKRGKVPLHPQSRKEQMSNPAA